MDNTVKTFPIRMGGEFHKQLSEAAQKENLSLHQFIINAITEKVKKDSN